MATGKNRQLASVDAVVARDSMGAIPGIGDAVPTPSQGSFPQQPGVHAASVAVNLKQVMLSLQLLAAANPNMRPFPPRMLIDN